MKNFLLLSAGVLLIPSCQQQKGKVSIVLKNLDVTADDEASLEALCDALIPSGATPGAKDVGAHLFVLKMVDDCEPRDRQQQLTAGFAALDKLSKDKAGHSFTECAPAQRQEVVALLEGGKGVPAEAAAFYTLVKKYTIEGYTTSQYYLTKVHLYELIPGRFHGCVSIQGSKSSI